MSATMSSVILPVPYFHRSQGGTLELVDELLPYLCRAHGVVHTFHVPSDHAQKKLLHILDKTCKVTCAAAVHIEDTEASSFVAAAETSVEAKTISHKLQLVLEGTSLVVRSAIRCRMDGQSRATPSPDRSSLVCLRRESTENWPLE